MHDSEPTMVPDVENGLPVLRWTVGGFLSLREHQLNPRYQYELMDGFVLHHGGHSAQHDAVISELARRLRIHSKGALGTGPELCFDDFSAVVRPDIVVSDGLVPELIVEVSDDAPRLDGLEKARLYARVGVEHYWHVDLAWRSIKIHSRPYSDGSYGMTLSGPHDRALPTGFAGLDELVLDELLEAAASF
jgi:Uma2 family endonuclease